MKYQKLVCVVVMALITLGLYTVLGTVTTLICLGGLIGSLAVEVHQTEQRLTKYRIGGGQ